MCLLVFYVNPSPHDNEYYLILINVRDEEYNRPTQLASFWKDQPHVIAGMDLEPGKEGGTWLAMNTNGKIGALLNILQPNDEILPNKKGRGSLAVNYILEDRNPAEYLDTISQSKTDYNGFLLVALDLRSLRNPSLAYFTNVRNEAPVMLSPGIHAFGNSRNPSEPWQKAVTAKEKFIKVVNSYGDVAKKDFLVKELFELLRDPTCHSIDANMESQGRGLSQDYLKKLSSIFVKMPEFNYGSRCHTVILIDKQGCVDYYERSRKENIPPASEELWIDNHHTFHLTS